jgi:predicted PhzF superfamily epimerase YddE/YHI9
MQLDFITVDVFTDRRFGGNAQVGEGAKVMVIAPAPTDAATSIG